MPKLTDDQAAQAGEGGDFEVLDPGPYVAVLNEVNVKEGQAGPYWEWVFVIHSDADGQELDPKPRLWENTSTSEKAIWRIGKMMDGFGVPHDTDTNKLLGRYVGVNVGQEIAQAGSRAGQLVNTFLSAFPIEDDS